MEERRRVQRISRVRSLHKSELDATPKAAPEATSEAAPGAAPVTESEAEPDAAPYAAEGRETASAVDAALPVQAEQAPATAAGAARVSGEGSHRVATDEGEDGFIADSTAPEDGDQVSSIASAGSIAPLVGLVTSGSRLSKERAAGALMHLSADPLYRDEIVRAGGIAPLIQLLDDGTQESHVVVPVVLARLAVDSPDSQIMIAKKLVALLFLPDAVPKRALSCLRDLALADQGAPVRIVNAGAISPLVSLLGNGLANVKEMAIDVLTSLGQRDASNQLAIATGLIGLRGQASAPDADVQVAQIANDFATASDLRASIAAAGKVDAGGGLVEEDADGANPARRKVKARRKSKASAAFAVAAMDRASVADAGTASPVEMDKPKQSSALSPTPGSRAKRPSTVPTLATKSSPSPDAKSHRASSVSHRQASARASAPPASHRQSSERAPSQRQGSERAASAATKQGSVNLPGPSHRQAQGAGRPAATQKKKGLPSPALTGKKEAGTPSRS